MDGPLRRQLTALCVLLAAACGDSTAKDRAVRAPAASGIVVATALAWTADSALLVGVLEMMGGGHVWAPDCEMSGFFRLEPSGNYERLEQSRASCTVLSSGDLSASESGLFIAFRSPLSTESREIKIFARKSRRARALAHRCAAEFAGPTWTARGDTLVVISRCGGSDSVLFFDMRGRFQRGHRLNSVFGSITGVALSDDVTRLAVYSVSSDQSTLSVFRLGSEQHDAVARSGVFPAWQPGGDLLVAAVADSGGTDLAFSKVQYGDSVGYAQISTYLTVRLPGSKVVPPLLWSRDGIRLLVSTGTSILSFDLRARKLDTLLTLAEVSHGAAASAENLTR